MRRFIKKPDASFVVIPGVGRVNTGQVLEGNEYAKFVPSLLVELLEEPAPLPSIPAPPPPPAPKPPPAILLDAGPVPVGVDPETPPVVEQRLLQEKKPAPKSPKPTPPPPAKKSKK